MKNSFRVQTLFIILCIVFASCQKDVKTDLNKPLTSDLQKMAAFVNKNEAKFEVFTVNASSNFAKFVSKNGVVYYIYPDRFTDDNGNNVTGNITFSVKEVLKVSDMILSNKPTLTSNGEILQSFGEFFVKVQQNNKNLKMKSDTLGSGIQMKFVNINKYKDNIPLWDGDTLVTQTQSGYNCENTLVSKSSDCYGFKGVDWKERYNEYAFPWNDSIDLRLPELFHWINCDALHNQQGTKTTVLCYFENYFNSETNTNYGGVEASMCFFKPDSINSVVKIYNTIFDAPKGKEGFLSYQNSLAIGLKGTFLALTVKDGKFYCQTKAATIDAPAAGKNYTPISFQLQEVTETELLNKINSLNQ